MAHRDKFGRTTFGRKWTRHDDFAKAPAPLPIKLPLRIQRANESFAIEDSSGRAVCQLCFIVEESQRSARFTEAEAGEMAQMIARLLTDL